MAYKPVALRQQKVDAEFTIDSVEEKVQANGVLALIARGTQERQSNRIAVTIFANGRWAEKLKGVLLPNSDVRLNGKFSQHNTFVATGLAA